MHAGHVQCLHDKACSFSINQHVIDGAYMNLVIIPSCYIVTYKIYVCMPMMSIAITNICTTRLIVLFCNIPS